MSILDQIASGGTPPVNPLDTLGKLQSLRTGQMQQQGLALENQQRQQAMQDSQALTKAYQEWDGKDYSDLAHLAVKNGATGTSAMAIQKHALDQRKMYSDMAKTDSETGKNNLEMAAKQNDLVAGHIANLQNVPDDQLGQAVIQTAQQLSQARGWDGKPLLDPQHVQSAQQIAQMPPEQQRAALSMFQKDFIAQSQQIQAAKTAAETKAAGYKEAGGVLYDISGNAPQPTGPMTTADNVTAGVLGMKAGDKIPLAVAKNAKETAAVGVKETDFNGKRQIINTLDPSQPARVLGNSPAVTTFNMQNGGMSQNALDMAAQQFAQTGQIPQGLGRNGVAGKQIMNRAAELYGKDLNPAAAHAIYQADTDALKKLQTQRDATVAFENTAGKNLDLFLKQAQKVVDSGSPWVNAPLRSVSQAGLGSADIAAYNTARQVAINEIAKVTASPGMSGQLSDSARHEVEAFNPANATLAQTFAVAKVLKQDMANRHDSYDQQIAEVQGRLRNSKGGNSPSNGGAQEVTATGPNGHKIALRGGKWVDAATGQPIQ